MKMNALEPWVTATQKKFVTLGPNVVPPGIATAWSRRCCCQVIGFSHESCNCGAGAPLLNAASRCPQCPEKPSHASRAPALRTLDGTTLTCSGVRSDGPFVLSQPKPYLALRPSQSALE
jgi:hypothetical protein